MTFNTAFQEASKKSAVGSWAHDPSRTIQEKLVRWSYWVIMRQRGIEYDDIAKHLGVARARVQQLLWGAGSSEITHLRLDAAISAISKAKHDAVCECDDPACLVYTVTTADDRLRQAEMGAINDWRERVPQEEETA